MTFTYVEQKNRQTAGFFVLVCNFITSLPLQFRMYRLQSSSPRLLG